MRLWPNPPSPEETRRLVAHRVVEAHARQWRAHGATLEVWLGLLANLDPDRSMVANAACSLDPGRISFFGRVIFRDWRDEDSPF